MPIEVGRLNRYAIPEMLVLKRCTPDMERTDDHRRSASDRSRGRRHVHLRKQILAAVKLLTMSSNLSSIKALLEPYAKSHAWRPQAGAFEDFDALLAVSAGRFNTTICQNNTEDRVKFFLNALSGMVRLIEGIGVATMYGTAQKESSYRHIAEKVVKDHLIRTASKAWTENRLIDGVLISTSIARESHASLIDQEVGQINKLKVFSHVEAYLTRVKSWNPVNAMVQSICYVTANRLQAKAYSGAHPSDENQSGHLMYAVQSDVAKEGHYLLLYHFEDPLTDAVAPGNGWQRIDAESIIAQSQCRQGCSRYACRMAGGLFSRIKRLRWGSHRGGSWCSGIFLGGRQ